MPDSTVDTTLEVKQGTKEAGREDEGTTRGPTPKAPVAPVKPSADKPANTDEAPAPEAAQGQGGHGASGSKPDDARVTVDQLYQQCHSAAARGDCTLVKQLAAKIAKASATVYRDKVAKDAAVVKCLQ
jgi:hypothetical protein